MAFPSRNSKIVTNLSLAAFSLKSQRVRACVLLQFGFENRERYSIALQEFYLGGRGNEKTVEAGWKWRKRAQRHLGERWRDLATSGDGGANVLMFTIDGAVSKSCVARTHLPSAIASRQVS